MCTAISFQTKQHYFGRNLDLEYRYDEAVTVTPRNFPIHFRHQGSITHHHAFIGIATVANDYPLYYEATNEHGLSIAGLNFPGNAKYFSAVTGKINLASYEFIPWLMSRFKSVAEAESELKNLCITNDAFSDAFLPTALHWIVADKVRTLAIESVEDGLKIYNNDIGVLTNNPPFPYQRHNLCNYINLSPYEAENRFTDKVRFAEYSRGMGAIGLPGDLSSSSRFVRAAFTKLNSVCGDTEEESISQFFHILNAVSQQRGCVRVSGAYEKTIYSSCCNTDKGILYYTTYENNQITAVDMHRTQLNGRSLHRFPLITNQQINYVN